MVNEVDYKRLRGGFPPLSVREEGRTSLFRGRLNHAIAVGALIAGLWLASGMVAATTNGAHQSSMTIADLTTLTLEQLVNIEVTSVSKKETGSKPACPHPSPPVT